MRDNLIKQLFKKKVKKISLQEVANREGYGDVQDMLAFYLNESKVPACCQGECEVEPDGECMHGHPSVLIESNYI